MTLTGLLRRQRTSVERMEGVPMIQPIVRDPMFLAGKSDPATAADLPVAADLLDTLQAHLEHCVGMAANMIGRRKRIIAFCNGPMQVVMLNPRIVAKAGEYEAEEGCLSLAGVRKTRRWRRITVCWQDQLLRDKTAVFEGFPAQIIQHEIDHCDGILI